MDRRIRPKRVPGIRVTIVCSSVAAGQRTGGRTIHVLLTDVRRLNVPFGAPYVRFADARSDH